MEKYFYPYFIQEEEIKFLEKEKQKRFELQQVYKFVNISISELIKFSEEDLKTHYEYLEKLREFAIREYMQIENGLLIKIIEKQLDKVLLINRRKEENNPIGISFVQQWIDDYEKKYILPLDIRDILEVDYFYAMELRVEELVKNIERLNEYKFLISKSEDRIVQKFVNVVNNMIDNYNFVLLKKCD